VSATRQIGRSAVPEAALSTCVRGELAIVVRLVACCCELRYGPASRTRSVVRKKSFPDDGRRGPPRSAACRPPARDAARAMLKEGTDHETRHDVTLTVRRRDPDRTSTCCLSRELAIMAAGQRRLPMLAVWPSRESWRRPLSG